VVLGSPELSLFGRGVVVNVETPVPEWWAESPVVVVDAAALDTPREVVTMLYAAWSARRPVVVELHVDPARFRTPESIRGEVWSHTTATEPWFDRLHFVVWANNYDARNGEPVWWWSTKASRLLAWEHGGDAGHRRRRRAARQRHPDRSAGSASRGPAAHATRCSATDGSTPRRSTASDWPTG
jgi:hypothetical protein